MNLLPLSFQEGQRYLSPSSVGLLGREVWRRKETTVYQSVAYRFLLKPALPPMRIIAWGRRAGTENQPCARPAGCGEIQLGSFYSFNHPW